jgi:predicted enzyme related to lactoylglutathione lyase
MATLSANSIAVDCPDPVALAAFYSGLFGEESRGDFVLIHEGKVDLWFQQVEDYLPPTWPTQERGQQVHFEMVTNDIPAAVRHAQTLGATKPVHQPDESEWTVMLDPAGHPFCLCTPFDNVEPPPHPETDVWIALAAVTFDCHDGEQLWRFYRNLADLTQQDVNGMAPALVADTGLMILIQQIDDYGEPTWPTQERGQQIHIDFHTGDRSGMVDHAIWLGAALKDVNKGFTVMLDPAGHPFCICDSRD